MILSKLLQMFESPEAKHRLQTRGKVCSCPGPQRTRQGRLSFSCYIKWGDNRWMAGGRVFALGHTKLPCRRKSKLECFQPQWLYKGSLANDQ